jgi:hypothetical protein
MRKAARRAGRDRDNRTQLTVNQVKAVEEQGEFHAVRRQGMIQGRWQHHFDACPAPRASMVLKRRHQLQQPVGIEIRRDCRATDRGAKGRNEGRPIVGAYKSSRDGGYRLAAAPSHKMGKAKAAARMVGKKAQIMKKGRAIGGLEEGCPLRLATLFEQSYLYRVWGSVHVPSLSMRAVLY